MRAVAICVIAVLLLTAGPAAAQPADACLSRPTFSAWLNCRIEAAVVRKAGASGEEKQAEPPSIANNSTSLLDLSSAPDLIGVGLTFLGIRRAGGDDTASTTSLTATAYSLVAAAQGADIFNADFYERYANWRRVSFTVGQQASQNDGKGFDQKATIVAEKILLLNSRELSRSDNLGAVQGALDKAAVSTAQTMFAVTTLLWSHSDQKRTLPEFTIDALDDTNFKATLTALPASTWPDVDSLIDANLRAQIALRGELVGLIAKIKRRPQLSIASASKLRTGTGPDEHRFAAIFDYGIAARLSTTLNASMDVVKGHDALIRDATTGRAAGALNLKLRAGNPFESDEPTSLGLAADAVRKHGAWTYSAQFKIDVAIAHGIRLPISVTRASRADLIDEKDVRGLFGFTIDMSKLAAALK
jgi:hypothetical protein